MRNPSRYRDRLQTIIDAWSNLRPEKSFAGMTLAEFKLAMAPSLEARNRLAEANCHVTKALVDRDNADLRTAPVRDRVVAAVVADEAEGNDGALYTAMGYVRKSDRSSGLTRRRNVPSETPVVLKAA